MNTSIKTTLSLTLMVFALTACSGSGGSGDNSIPPVTPPPVDTPTPPPTSDLPDPGEVVEVNSLKQGVCANLVNGDAYVSRVIVTRCDEPHDLEVSGVVERSEALNVEYPGANLLDFEANVACRESFEAATGSKVFDLNDGVEIDTLTPSAFTWEDGDRTVICLIVNSI